MATRWSSKSPINRPRLLFTAVEMSEGIEHRDASKCFGGDELRASAIGVSRGYILARSVSWV